MNFHAGAEHPTIQHTVKRPAVISINVYRGPHLYSHTPMISVMLDLGALEEWPSNKLPGFCERLLSLLPSLHKHGCSYNEPGGFVRRLKDGTWFGHVAEHVAIELQSKVGATVTRGKTRSVRGKPGVYRIMYAYEDERVGLLAGRLALEVLDSLLPPELKGIEGLEEICEREADAGRRPFDFSAGMAELERAASDCALGPTTGSLAREAMRRGIPVTRRDGHSLIQLGQGKHRKLLRASITGCTSYLAVETASDKDLTKQFLRDAGVAVPDGVCVHSEDEAEAAANKLGYPVVVKPLDGNHGRGVTIGLQTSEAVKEAFRTAEEISSCVVVEKRLEGRDHRILVVGGEVVAVAERVPAHVVGDGRRTITQLVEAANFDPRRGDGHERSMTRIIVDNCVLSLLAKSGLSPQSIPAAGQTVYLRATANMSTGGTAIDRTDDIHPVNAGMARRAVAALGLDVGGVDFIAPDIRRPVTETGGGVVEVNASPGFRMHLEPSEGRARNVARPVIELLYPYPANGRIPVISITGTNGKSTTAKMVTRIFQTAGCTVGLATTTGIYINDERVLKADASGPASARALLGNPQVDVAVLEAARGGILREGLGFDRCDVGAVLNISADHLGTKGIDTLEDLAAVKSVVVETVHRDGYSILNADDPLTAGMDRHAGGRIAFFSMRGGKQMTDAVKQHIASSGCACVLERCPQGCEIVVYDRGDRTPLLLAEEIPATLNGAAEFNVQNALAAVLIAHARGVPPSTVRRALMGFNPSFEENPGRLNVFDRHGFRVILDYAHNPAGLEALGSLVAKLRSSYRCVIGTVSVAGDRRDEDMIKMGSLAAGLFDQLFLWEDEDLRGRPAGEVMDLLAAGATSAGTSRCRIHKAGSEIEAAEAALRTASFGDLVIVTSTEIETAWRTILSYQPLRLVELPSPLSRRAPAQEQAREFG